MGTRRGSDRGRLIAEERNGAHPYHLHYTYDQGGNRLQKLDLLNSRLTTYHCDVHSPELYQTQNNRLMSYEVTDLVSGALIERPQYGYDLLGFAAGNPVRIIHKNEGDPTIRGTCLAYHPNGELWIVTQQTWGLDGGGRPINIQTERIIEFRGSGKQRYLLRERDSSEFAAVVPDSTIWHRCHCRWVHPSIRSFPWVL